MVEAWFCVRFPGKLQPLFSQSPEQVLFHISGFATMTLLINGTFAPLVLQSLGMMATVEEHQLGGVQGFIGFRGSGLQEL